MEAFSATGKRAQVIPKAQCCGASFCRAPAFQCPDCNKVVCTFHDFVCHYVFELGALRPA